jgi:GTP cyclohydrolase II
VLLARPAVIAVRFREAVTVSGVVVAVVVAAALVAGRHWARGGSKWLAVSLGDVRRGVLARDAWPGVVLLSVLTFAGHLALFLVAARTAGSTASFTRLLPLMVLTLLAMGLPVNIGGWGPREGVAALVFGAAGLSAERGLATAVVYGVLALVASLPGAVVLSRSYGPRAPSVERVVHTRLATVYGDLRAVGYRDRGHVREQVALLYGDVTGHGVLTRVHSECLTGDVFGSTHCECGDQLSAALRAIVAEGAGVLVYVKGHEGRGIGLLAKLEAMSLQDEGLDTVEANLALGLPIDARDYRVAAEILHDLGVRSVRLLSNNPLKLDALRRHGIRIAEQVPLLIPPGGENLRYLRTKRERLDHHLPHLDVGQLSADSVSPKETTRLASTSRPFSADASEGRPTTPDSV